MSVRNGLPTVSMILTAYNEARFVREAVSSALLQDYPQLEIIISDDCSNDATFAEINATVSGYAGPHQVIVRRNQSNIGIADHFSDLVAMAHGEIIVVANGDDISFPRRVSMTVDLFSSDPKASIVSFNDVVIDANGTVLKQSARTGMTVTELVRLEDYLPGHPHISAASRGFRRSIFETFGRLDPACPTEDTPYLLRGLMIGHVLVSPEPGISYRRHGGSFSNPERTYRVDFGAIREQYRTDAAVALSKGIVTAETYQRILEWADVNFRRRKLFAGFYLSGNSMRYYFSHVLFSRDLRIREKVDMLRNAIR